MSRSAQVDIQKTLHSGPAKLETSLLLRNLLPEMEDLAEKTFLQEAIDCYEIGARRSAIVMVWILVIHHMNNFVLSSELAAFNAVLATNNDKRIRIKAIAKIDDFTEIPEGKFIEILRVAGIISNDVRKILDVKLGIRNSSAHPSAINISEVKATDFIIDLVENVIRKYRCP
ncbi:hypothetical protein [Pseudomonas sp. ICMP 561]|uniref:hypothetical protein n=1 Tax=Pseudomonas sp. ICMP 561 TaxID=1718918 RepID=UPI001C54F51E|nr:hypothetical protein [Pseudomonas sp. ICMP 561]